MPVFGKDDAVVHRMHGATFHSYAAPGSGSRELCAWRLEVAGGTRGLPHTVTREEVFLMLTGTVRLTLDGVGSDLTAGEVALIPAGATLDVANPSADPATAWVTTSVGLQATTGDGTVITPPWTQ